MKDKWQELNNSYKREKCNKLRRKDKGQRNNISKDSSKLKEFKDKINKRLGYRNRKLKKKQETENNNISKRSEGKNKNDKKCNNDYKSKNKKN